MSFRLTRRDLLRGATVLGAAAGLGLEPWSADAARLPGGSLLDLPATASPIDTIVVMMMENRSFDHYLGFLGEDPAYLEEGRLRYGRRFKIDASTTESYPDPDGVELATYPIVPAGEDNPWRGCGHPDPGHGWTAGRRQRDDGFLATGSGNDEYALGFYRDQDLALYASLSRQFTVCDRYHCSVLGPTFPNREYLHSGQSGGIKNNAFPFQVGYPDGFTWPTIWDRLAAAGVPARYYYTDLPVVALWGARLLPISSTIANYFTDAAAGQLPNVVFLDPGFVGETRTDEHPHGDVRDGQRLVEQCLRAFVDSPHWERGVFILTYDEWGGFFDHVRPARFKDDLASRIDDENFGQGGFRVPTRIVSPYARRNFVDHTLYDHTSILRFIQWRFLGAPARGKGRSTDGWYLVTRDRYARNIGWSLKPDTPDLDFDLPSADPATSDPCGSTSATAAPLRTTPPAAPHDLAAGREWFEQLGYEIGTWLP
jgi:phospholipase C